MHASHNPTTQTNSHIQHVSTPTDVNNIELSQKPQVKGKNLEGNNLNIIHLNVRGLRTNTKYTIFTEFISQL